MTFGNRVSRPLRVSRSGLFQSHAAFTADVVKAKADWRAKVEPRENSTETPFTSQRPLVALDAVNSAGFFGRAWDAIRLGIQ